MKYSCARAPAKVILTGEHAVLYGVPAVALAVNRFATTEIMHAPHGLTFLLHDVATSVQATYDTIRIAHQRIKQSYDAFIRGEVSIRDVLRAPVDAFQFALSELVDEEHGLHIHVQSSIPIGCGMGSSAATITSFIHAVIHHLGMNKPLSWIEQFIVSLEHLQHGKASGIDSFLALHGGCCRFCSGESPHMLPMPSLPFWIIVTGTPQSTTGECVSHVARHWQTSTIWHEFALLSESMITALHHREHCVQLMRKNHQLLCQLGVVPMRVQTFIEELEKQGGAAKVSGAGSITGDSAGILIALTNEPHALCAAYGYECFPLEGASMEHTPIIVSVPSSIMLFGEHDVLRGGPAIVAATHHRMTLTLVPIPEPIVDIISDKVGCAQTSIHTPILPYAFRFIQQALCQYSYPSGARISIASDIATTVGLGSSAAISVAIITALRIWLGLSHDNRTIALEARALVQAVQGCGSGADVASIVYGGVISYSMEPFCVKRLCDTLPITLVYSGYKTATAEVIAYIQQQEHRYPHIYHTLFTAMRSSTEEAIQALLANDLRLLGTLMNIQHHIMNALGVGTHELSTIFWHLHAEEGIYGAKISGSGLGDCIVGLGTAQEQRGTIPIQISTEGIIICH